MRVRFFGTRGSIPVTLDHRDVAQKIREALVFSLAHDLRSERDVDAFMRRHLAFATAGTYGGNTSCVAVESGDRRLILDMGSGLRVLGTEARARHDGRTPMHFDILISHLHWDHIAGFPFFAPAAVPGTTITLHGCHDTIEAALRRQHGAPSFPITYDEIVAKIDYNVIEPGRTTRIGGFSVTPRRQRHHGDSFAYRIDDGARSIVYASDAEYEDGAREEAQSVAAFFRDTDLVVFDAMYVLAEAETSRRDWGHSSNIVGADLCMLAGARRLCLFHHDPQRDDAELDALLEQTRRYVELHQPLVPLEVVSAFDGLELAL